LNGTTVHRVKFCLIYQQTKQFALDKFESEAKRRRFDNKNSFLQVASVLWLEFQLEIIQIIVDWPN
jgi:hypothetical protein